MPVFTRIFWVVVILWALEVYFSSSDGGPV